MSPVYWRVLLSEGGSLKVVCLQDFDEKDYDQNRFVTDKKFDSELEAEQFLCEQLRILSKIQWGN